MFSAKDRLEDDRLQKFSANGSGFVGNRYLELKEDRKSLTEAYIRAGKVDAAGTQRHFDDATNFVGECEDMCPEYERHEREFEKTVDKFEALEGSENPVRIDHRKAVKRCRRSAADDAPPLPCDVRTPAALLKSLDYLLNDILGTYGIRPDSHIFIWDRTRSINKDFQYQNWRGPERIVACEKICRYLALSLHVQNKKNWESNPVDLKKPQYDPKQDYEQLCKVLVTLLELYGDAEPGMRSPNEAEFRAYAILAHLLDPLPFELESLSDEVFHHPRLQRAIRFHALAGQYYGYDHGRSYRYSESAQNAFYAFFQAIKTELNVGEGYVEACLLELSFNVIRRGALSTLSSSCMVRYGHPVSEITKVLAFSDAEEAVWFCGQYGIFVSPTQSTHFQIGKDKGTVVFREPQERLFTPHSAIVNRLLGNYTLTDIVHGVGLPHSSLGAISPVSTLPLSNAMLAPAQPLAAAQTQRLGWSDSNASLRQTATLINPTELATTGNPFSDAALNSHTMVAAVPTPVSAPFNFQKVKPLKPTESDGGSRPQPEAVHEVKDAIAARPPAVSAPKNNNPIVPPYIVDGYVDALVSQEIELQGSSLLAQAFAWYVSLRLQAERIVDVCVREIAAEESRYALVQEFGYRDAVMAAEAESIREIIADAIVREVCEEEAALLLLHAVGGLQSSLFRKYCIAKKFASCARSLHDRRKRRERELQHDTERQQQILRTISALGLPYVDSSVGGSCISAAPLYDVLNEDKDGKSRVDNLISARLPTFSRLNELLTRLDALPEAINLAKFVKVAVVVNPLPTGIFDLFSHRAAYVNEWLCAKFGVADSLASELPYSSASGFTVLVTRLQGGTDVREGAWKGTGVIVLALEPFTRPYHGTAVKWWHRQREYLEKNVLANTPRGCQVKILLLYFDTGDDGLSFELFKSAPDLRSFVASHEKESLSITLLPISALRAHSDEKKCTVECEFATALTDLSKVPPLEYRFSELIFDEYIGSAWSLTLSTINDFLTRREQMCAPRERVLSLAHQVSVFNFILQSWNGFVDLCSFIFGDDELSKVSWPCEQISGKKVTGKLLSGLQSVPGTDWNNAAKLESFQEYSKKCHIPLFEACLSLTSYHLESNRLLSPDVELRREGAIFQICESFAEGFPGALKGSGFDKAALQMLVLKVFETLDQTRDSPVFEKERMVPVVKTFERLLQGWTLNFLFGVYENYGRENLYFERKARTAALSYQRQSEKSLTTLLKSILRTNAALEAPEVLLSTPKVERDKASDDVGLLYDEHPSSISLVPYESSIASTLDYDLDVSLNHGYDMMSVTSVCSRGADNSCMSLGSTDSQSSKRKRKVDKLLKREKKVRMQEELLKRALQNLESSTSKAGNMLGSL